MIHSMHRVTRILLILLFASACSPAIAATQPPPPSPTASPKAEPTPIPLANVPLEAEATISALQEINANSSKDQSNADLIAANIANLAAEIDARISDDTRLLQSSQSLDTLNRLTVIWTGLRDNLSALSRQLTQCAKNLDQEIARLDQIEETWQATLPAANQPNTPPVVLQKVQSTLASVQLTQKMVESGRAKVLAVQTHLSEEEARIRTALSSVEQLQENALKTLVVKDSPAIWNLGRDGKTWGNQFGKTFSWQLTASAAFAERLPYTFFIHGLVILIFAAAIQWMRRRVRKFPDTIQDLDRAMPILDLPVSAAFALSMLVVPSIYPQAPRLIQAIMGAVALIPTIKVLRRLLPQNLHPILHGLVVMYFLSQIRLLSASMADSSRLIFLGQMLAGSIFLFWLLRRPHLKKVIGETQDRISQTIRVAAKIGLILLPVALITNALGYANLGNLLGIVFIRSMFVAAALYSAIRIIEGLVILGLQVRPLRSLRTVQTSSSNASAENLHRPGDSWPFYSG